jgi:hypothetical protein
MADEYQSSVDPKIVDEARRRLGDARREKSQFNSDFTEAFQFCMPQRVRPNTTATVGSRSNNAAENFTSLGPMLTADFASDISDTFAPEHTPWAGEEITSAVPEQFADDAKDAVKKDAEAVFQAIGASNFYEAFKQGAKDLSVSAFGLIIEDPGRGEPFRCQVVPLTELLILRAPTGGIGVRFWEQAVLVDDVLELFPDVPLPKKVLAKKDKKSATVRKTQGCWRDYASPGVLAWHCLTLLDDEPIEYSHYDGTGSAPILVCRWNADSPFAWGNGPGIVALPDFRALDEVNYLILKGMARAVDPPVAYKDDGDINLEGGLANGVLIPCLDEPSFKVIESENPNSMSDAVKLATDLEHTIRQHYYLDEPQQDGLTPPTLGQWMDESMRRQRRLATPAASIWTEFLSEVFMRFRYLLVKRGDVSPQIKVGGKAVALRAVNPLERAAKMEEAAASLRALQSIGALFGPPILPMVCDVGATIHALVEQSNATGVKLKPVQAINAALAQASQMNTIGQAATAVGQSGVLPLLAQQKQGTAPA